MNKKILLFEFGNFFAFIYCLFKFMQGKTDYLFFLLPLIFCILFLICFKSRKLIGKIPGISTITVVMLFRYIILPVVLCRDGELSRYANNYEYIGQAILIMIYEMIAIFAMLELTSNNIWKIYKTHANDKANNVIIKTPFLIVSILCCIIVTIYLFNKDILNGNIFYIKNAPNNVDESISDVSSFVKIIWQCVTTWFFVYGINRQKDKYVVDKKNIHIIISIIYMLLFMIITYIGQARISRWYTLVSAVTSIFVLTSLFPNKKRIIVLTTIVPTIILILTASLLKAGLYTSGENNNLLQLKKLITPTSGDAYFAGPVSINNAIGLSKTNNVGLHNIIYDICNNMPLVNHFIKPKNSTVYLYNAYLGRIFNSSSGDQIIPLVGQSGIFFTWIFAPVLSCISIFFMRVAEKKYIQSTSYIKYVWGFVAIWLALEPILNLTINLSWMYIRIIPMLITFVVIEKISYKQKEVKQKGEINERKIKNIQFDNK